MLRSLLDKLLKVEVAKVVQEEARREHEEEFHSNRRWDFLRDKP